MMKQRVLVCLTVLPLGVLCLTRSAAAQNTEPRESIEAINNQFEAAVRKGDGAALSGFYTADAQALVPNAPPIMGRNAIATTFGTPMHLDLTTLEVESMGDTAYEVGAYTIAGSDGKTVDEGKYVVIWKREDGQWKLHRDIMNSSMPAPSSAASQTAALPRAAEGETIGMAVFYVKPEMKEAFERFVEDVLIPAADEVEPVASEQVRFWASAPNQPDLSESIPWENGLPYAFVFDAFVDGANYDIPSILEKVHGPERAAQYMQDFDTYINGYTYTHFTQK